MALIFSPIFAGLYEKKQEIVKADIFISIKFFIYFFLTLPHLLIYSLSSNKKLVHADIERWRKVTRLKYSWYGSFIYFLMAHREFRNLFYYRVGGIMYILLNFILPKMNTLFIHTPPGKIGKGLFIHHGFATIISAKEIGDNCWVNQQVTIGYTNDVDCPVLLNNVRVAAGAKVLGNICCGNNTVIGANAVVTKNVPDNCTVAGVPAYIIKRNGVSVKEPL